MVSKASEDLPEPDKPVNTISASRGISRSTFFRLCSRAPRTWIVLWPSPTGVALPASAGDLLTIFAIGSVLCFARVKPPLQRGCTLCRRPSGNDRRHADVLVYSRPMNSLTARHQLPIAALLRRRMQQPRIPSQGSRDSASVREVDSQGITGHGYCRRKGHTDHLAQTSWTGNASQDRVHRLRK